MADITRIARFLNGAVRGLDLTSNTPVVLSIKIGGVSNTELTKTILDRLVSLQNGSDVDATYHTHDGRYFTETELGSTSNGLGASLIGIEDASTQFTSTNVEGALTESLDAAQAAQVDATQALSDAADAQADATQALSDAADAQAGVDALVTLSGVASLATSLGTFTGSVIPDSSTVKAALQSLETYDEATRAMINGLEWQDSALSYVADNTVAPATEVSGDRYILSDDGGAPHADYDGASAGSIVEFDGSVWVETVPSTGMFISADDEDTILYYWGGSSWMVKSFEATTASTGLTKVGFDVRLANAATANGISVSSGAISVELGTDSGLAFSSGALVVDFGTSGIKAVTAANLASTSNGLGASLIGIEDSGTLFTATTVEGALAELKADLLAQDEADEITYSNATSGLTATDVQAAIDEVEGRVDTLEAQPTDAIQESFPAGETFAADTLIAVRMAKPADAGFVAGRVYAADIDATSVDNWHSIGLIIPAAQADAGDPVTVTKFGKMTVTAHGFTVGQPIYMDADGEVTGTPTSTASEAVVELGIARDANTIEVAIKPWGVN